MDSVARSFDLKEWIIENTDIRPEQVVVECWRAAQPDRYEMQVTVQRSGYWAILRGPTPAGEGEYRKASFRWSGSGPGDTEAMQIEFIRLMLAAGAVAEHLDRQLSGRLEDCGLVHRVPGLPGAD